LVAVNITLVALSIHGTGVPVRTGDERHIGTDRFVFTSVTPAGLKGGVRVGDVFDTRLLTLRQRMQSWNKFGSASTVVVFPVLRGGRIVSVHQPFAPAPPEAVFLDDVFLVIVCISALCGLILIARGRDAASLAAGIMLVSLSFYQQSFPAWNAPLPIVVGIFLISIWSVTTFGVSAFILGLLLLPKTVSRIVRAILISGAALAIGASFLFWTLDYSVWNFTGHTIFNGEQTYEYSRLAQIVVIVTTFGIAAATVRGKAAAAARVFFVATLIGFGADAFLFVSQLLGRAVSPGETVAYVVCWTVLCGGYLYALLGKRLVSLDFVINRAAVFAVIVALVSAVLVLVEKLVERFAVGAPSGFIIELAATLLIALSFKWIERRVQDVVEHLFYRDKLRAAETLRALADDFPFLRDPQDVVELVAREVRRNMHSPHTAIYLAQAREYRPVASDGEAPLAMRNIPDSDALILRLQSRRTALDTRDFATAFPGSATLFPLCVFGAVIGCLRVDERSNGEALDPDERAVLMDLARETAAAITWLKGARSSAATLSVVAE
jgi:hypothetical protein